MNEQQFRTFLVDRYYRRGDRPRFPNILEFQQQNERVYQLIHVDLKRSCNLVKFYVNDPKQLPKFQILLENYFLTLLLQLPIEGQNLYYQSLSDLFEVIFVAFVNFPYVVATKNFFQYQNGDYTPFYGDPQQFYLGYDLMVNVGATIIQRMYESTGFATAFFERQIQVIHDVLRKKDPQLGALFADCQSSQYAMLLKLAITNALHYCTQPSIAYQLVRFQLENDSAAAAAFDALFLSCCCRTYAPDLLDFDERYSNRLKSDGVSGLTNRHEQLFDVMSNAFLDVLAIHDNLEVILALMDEALHYCSKGMLTKVLSIGGGIAAGLIGGGLALLGGIIASNK